ncbi:hypothetical protein U0070_007973 [Myodes glareolus]|uniref:Uncharacterized protein n=1 Tax=Myodes glareolus TaxID=447135 RepID=A0AAW0IGN4_MYOGA
MQVTRQSIAFPPATSELHKGGGSGAFKIQPHPSSTAMAQEAIAAGGVLDVSTALREVLKNAQFMMV